ncbi:6349_t:CDS:1, partial [Funneliformis caledonium]
TSSGSLSSSESVHTISSSEDISESSSKKEESSTINGLFFEDMFNYTK